MTAGIVHSLKLPPIVDPEGDSVKVSVQLDGELVSSCTSGCHVKFNANEGEISIDYPLFYFFDKD